MAVTIKDIAKLAGVSYATVSRALNDHSEVSVKTKELVLKIAKEHGYSPNEIARGLVKQSTNTIGLLVPDISNPYFPEVAKGVEEKAISHDYHVFLCNTDWDSKKEIDYVSTLRDKRVAGIIVAPTSIETYAYVRELNLDIPVVYIGSRCDEEEINYVVIDNEKASLIATEYLIELGFTEIAYLGGSENSVSNRDRLIGYKKALTRHNLDRSVYIMKGSSFRRESGYKAVVESIKTKMLPHALICANDIVALGAIEALENNGYNVPEDVSVIGFDDIAYASLHKINLTTVAQPKYEIGSLAAGIVLEKISEGNGPGKKIVLEPTLIKRGTCKS